MTIIQKGEPMNKLIDINVAIDAINELHDKPNAWLDLAVEALEKLPSAELEERTKERTETHACDCISREAAIDAICAVCGNDCDKSEFVYNAPQDEQVILCPEHYCLCTLPSAQPETNCSEIPNNSDTISRQQAIDALDKRFGNVPMEQTAEILMLRKDLRELPFVQPEMSCSEIPNNSDLISRQAAIEVLRNRWLKTRNYEGIGEDIAEECEIYLKTLPSAQPEIKTDGDTISRQQTIDALMQEFKRIPTNSIRAKLVVENLPSAQPERKTGRWIYEERKRLVDETDDGPVYRTEKWWSCSECGYTKGYQISKPSSNYCENCGAKMLNEGKE